MTTLKIIGCIAAVVILMLFIRSGNMSPEESARYANKQAVDAACDQMMSDSALGNERRMTRSVCDSMKATAAQQR
jgi:hypothetical protein